MRALSLLLTLAATPLALASPQLSAPDANGFVWATIGAPGNPHAPQVGGFWPSDPPRGAVDYEYRMSRNELTVGQWLEFINAYRPFADFPNDSTLTGAHIGTNPDGTYFIFGDDEIVQHWGAEVNARYAARYANWLHNGKVNEPWAFESGVYDTSTFGQVVVDGITIATDDYTRSPDAKYWIPSLDEWVKAAYYDPNRFGEGHGGYWQYPHASDALPITGRPEDGGQTNAGVPVGEPLYILAVGSYESVQSPWGLLDASGGKREFVYSEYHGRLFGKGSSYLTTPMFHAEVEHYESLAGMSVFTSLNGFRLASAVPIPSPTTLTLVPLVAAMIARRHRKERKHIHVIDS